MSAVLDKIEKILKEKKWSKYRLSMEAGITQSTITNMFKRQTEPSVKTLEAICEAFGMSLSQFFMEDNAIDILTPKEKKLIEEYRLLEDSKQMMISEIITVYKEK